MSDALSSAAQSAFLSHRQLEPSCNSTDHTFHIQAYIQDGSVVSSDARRYNFDSPIFVGFKGMVFKRYEANHGSHTQSYRGHLYKQDSDDLDADEYGYGETAFRPEESDVTEVPAEDVKHDQEYVVPVLVGTPGVVLHLDFDTGSSDLWVWSSELRIDTRQHNIYIPEESDTAQELVGASWNISYGDGSTASGNVYIDNVTIGDITISEQAIELAEDLSQSFVEDVGSDGLLGLAWPTLNTVKPHPVRTPIENIMAQRLAPGIFSVALDRGDGDGFYTFGGIDPSRAGVYDSDIIYTAIDNSQGFWMFSSESVRVDGYDLDLPGNRAILDTGTSLALLSDTVVRTVYSTIPGAYLDEDQGGWIYPKEEQVPIVQLAVGEYLFEISPANFGFSNAGKGLIFGGIQSRGNNPYDILGDVFLKGIYAVFDQENISIGVAQRPE